ncbi:MAG: clostripain-related cysteine peptidase [Candidatus Cryptobacteroides sp.]
MYIGFSKYLFKAIGTVLAITALAISCNELDDFNTEFGNLHQGIANGKSSGPDFIKERTVSKEIRKVMILYSAGYNSLSNYLKEDIEDLKKGFIPGDRRSDNILLVFSKLPISAGEYRTKTSPVLFRLYKNNKGKCIADTLLTLPPGTIAASTATFGKVMNYIKDNFNAAGYGLIVSSHATGWLPNGYYNNPSMYDPTWSKGSSTWRRFARASGAPDITYNEIPFPYIEIPQDPNLPAVKSITQEVFIENNLKMSYEAELVAFANAIPMHLEYLLFDACLMGGIEVAHAFKDKTSYIGFSQTEVLAEGYDYNTIAKHLIETREPDAKSVCSDFFDYYNKQSGQYRSATISFVDCSKIDNLAAVCKEMFTKYRAGLNSIDFLSVQRYYRFHRHWFYDLKDIIAKSGASEEDLAKLQKALDDVIVYKGATPAFLGIDINTFSGFSMYLPAHGSPFLNNYYKTLSWNTATSLVQ